MALFWSFSTAGGYIPLILRQKGIDTEQTLNETYVGYIEIYTPGVSSLRTLGMLPNGLADLVFAHPRSRPRSSVPS